MLWFLVKLSESRLMKSKNQNKAEPRLLASCNKSKLSITKLNIALVSHIY